MTRQPPGIYAARVNKPPLQKQSVLLNLWLCLITLGVYMPIWFLRRREGFDALGPVSLKAWPLWVALAISVLDAVLTGLDMAGLHKVTLIGMLLDQLCFQLLSLAGFAILTIESFKLKRQLEAAYGVQLDSLLLLFFTIWYLQHWINHLVDRQAIGLPQEIHQSSRLDTPRPGEAGPGRKGVTGRRPVVTTFRC